VRNHNGAAGKFLRPLAFVGALTLLLGLATSALAADDWATVTGYAAGTSDNNQAETWAALYSADCTKIDGGNSGTYVLPDLDEGLVYVAVIVKAGSDESTDEHANTIFESPLAGQTVWGDSNGDGAFNEGDKIISHIIVCTGEAESSSSASSSASSSEVVSSASSSASQPEGGELGGNPTPAASQPDTAMGVQGGLSPVPTAAFALILLAALGTLAWANVKTARSRG
jgi:hypothetical protein